MIASLAALRVASTIRTSALSLTVAVAALTSGCADNGTGGFFTTGALGEAPKEAPKPAVDPACAGLASQIETLKADGAVGRLEKAADGKSSAVEVKRATLAMQAQLNKANADFIAKCGPQLPKSTVATATPAAAPAAKASVAKVAAKAKTAAVPAAADSGVTVAAPSAIVQPQE